jgi:hypothetical protein
MSKMNWDRVKKEGQILRNLNTEARDLEYSAQKSSTSKRKRKLRAGLQEEETVRLLTTGYAPCKYCGVLVKNQEKHTIKVHREKLLTDETPDKALLSVSTALESCKLTLEELLRRASIAWGDPVKDGKVSAASAKRFRKNLLLCFSTLVK